MSARDAQHTLDDVFDVLVEVRNLLSGAENATWHGSESRGRAPLSCGRLNDLDPTGTPGRVPPRSSLLSNPRASLPLSCTVDRYLKQKRHEVSPQHLDIVRLTLRTFTTEAPSAPCQAFGREYVTAHRQRLLDEGRSVSTVNHHMAIISAFFAWAVAQGLREDNPASGLKLRDRTKASRKRKAFTASLIEDVFDGLGQYPLHLGVPSVASAKRWLPLIMLYTGARPEEVAQLRVGDVRLSGQRQAAAWEGGKVIGTADAGWVFDFATLDNGQRRKNEASRRLVPVHPRLWELGLQQLLRTRSPAQSLFPELTPGANGRLAEAPSRWFNQTWLRKVKSISDRKLVLYSLRHSVATTLKHQGVEESLIAQLLGHSNGNMTTGRYGKEYPIQQLAEVVGKLDWKV